MENKTKSTKLSKEDSSEEETLTEDPNSKPREKIYRRFRAGGILPYTIILGEVYILLGRQSRGWSDFGGYISKNETIEVGSAREFSEETLGLFYDLALTENSILQSTQYFSQLISFKPLLVYDGQGGTVTRSENGVCFAIEKRTKAYKMFIAPVPLRGEQELLYYLKLNRHERRLRHVEKSGFLWFSVKELLKLLRAPISPSSVVGYRMDTKEKVEFIFMDLFLELLYSSNYGGIHALNELVRLETKPSLALEYILPTKKEKNVSKI